eukprot:1278822-Heterocapsa_arctica.AAC.1
MARRPFAISAASFAVCADRSEEVGTMQPKSPLLAEVPGDWSLLDHCWIIAGSLFDPLGTGRALCPPGARTP